MMLCRRALFAAARSARATNTNGSMTAMPIISRSFADDAPASASDTAKAGNTFAAKWKKVMPNMERPKLSLDNMEARPGVPTPFPTKLTVNFSMPYQVELSSKEVDMVIVPATTGQMGVLPGHVPTIVELKPGLMSVHDGSDVTKYFISSGFAFIHANSYTDIMAVEAVPLDRIDPDQVKANLSEYQQKLAAAATDLEKAEAQIGIELHSTLSAALSG